MSPIENVWRILKRRIQNRHPRPSTVPALYTAIQEEWDSITPDVTGAPYREVNSKVATAPKLKVEDKDRVINSRRMKTV